MDDKSANAWIQQLRDCLYALSDVQLAGYLRRCPEEAARLGRLLDKVACEAKKAGGA
jgi:hypothetical protein